MSWKPSRSSGIMIDKYAAKSDKNKSEFIRLIQSQEYLKLKNINKLSKYLYLYWLNENKKHCALVGKRFTPQSSFYSVESCSIFPFILPMLIRNLEMVYKPMKTILTNNKTK